MYCFSTHSPILNHAKILAKKKTKDQYPSLMNTEKIIATLTWLCTKWAKYHDQMNINIEL